MPESYGEGALNNKYIQVHTFKHMFSFHLVITSDIIILVIVENNGLLYPFFFKEIFLLHLAQHKIL